MKAPRKPSYTNVRALATRVLSDVLSGKQSCQAALLRYKKECQNPSDAALLQALTFGVLRWYSQLHFICLQLLQKPFKPKDYDLLYLLCVGLYQLKDLHLPAHAALSETVEAARVLQKPWATGLVNGVLRAYQRQSEILITRSAHPEEAYYAHPQWIINALKHAWPEHWRSILEANNEHPPLTLRVNLSKHTREDYLEALKTAGIEAEALPYAPAGIKLKTPKEVSLLPGFNTGACSVQDEAAQYAAPLLQLQPGLRVLDACAAPGGKTAHILETEPNLEEVVALDISAQRMHSTEDTLSRLGLKATLLTADALTPATWWDGMPFDRILLDAPCSAMGVIRRHPDIKHLRTPADIQKLSQQQLQLLEALWPLLSSGGILVYATCSIFPEENVDVLAQFLQHQKEAKLISLELPSGIPQKHGLQLLPGQQDTDGFYYACLLKD